MSRAGHLRVKSTGDNPLYHEGEKPVVRVVRDALIIEVRQRGKKYTTVIPLKWLARGAHPKTTWK